MAHRLSRFAILVAIYLVVVYLVPKPAAVKPEGWRLTGLFIATVAGLMLQPIAGGALVLTSVTLSAVLGCLTVPQALAGYSDTNNWLVIAAFFISRALINTGLARRIALFFVRLFGGTSLGVSYALSLSDVVLATVIPSNGARSGGVTLPIVRSVAELYDSRPGPTASVIGRFLMVSVFQGICISTAMFLTGQSSNPLGAKMAGEIAHVDVTWTSWFLAASVPGFASLLVVPWAVMKMDPPERTRTPEAAAFARTELEKMGPMSKQERMLMAMFLCTTTAWMFSKQLGWDVTLVALCGAVSLLLLDILTWEDVKNERAAWDMFIWYGGLLMLGRALNQTGVPTEFAKGVGGFFDHTGWVPLFVAAFLVYFYAHYAFASITAHLLAMFPAFLAVLMAKGAPPALSVYAFACGVNLSAGLTTYGTTPAPMFFAQDYVDFKSWWKIGFVASVINIAIWGTLGPVWWKVLGLW